MRNSVVQQQGRLKASNARYRHALAMLHIEFQKEHTALVRKHGDPQHVDTPHEARMAYHEAIAPARDKFLAGMRAAQAARAGMREVA